MQIASPNDPIAGAGAVQALARHPTVPEESEHRQGALAQCGLPEMDLVPLKRRAHPPPQMIAWDCPDLSYSLLPGECRRDIQETQPLCLPDPAPDSTWITNQVPKHLIAAANPDLRAASSPMALNGRLEAPGPEVLKVIDG